MDQPPVSSIQLFFGDLPDPRIDRSRRHELLDILTIALCATIGGAEGWVQIVAFARCKEAFFRGFLTLPNGIPSHDTFGRVFALLDPVAFERCFVAWVAHLTEDMAGEVVPIDGKALRRAVNRAAQKNPLYLVSAWAAESGLVLGQVAVDDKSNEITAIPKLLKLLDIKGATVTIDAAGCQTAIAAQIVEQQGDYVLAVKGNQDKLEEGVRRLMEEVRHPIHAEHVDYHETVEKGHGRIETRRVWCTDRVDWLYGQEKRWQGLACVAMVESERTIGDKTSVEHRYYISSLAAASAERMARTIRQHWTVENNLHWTLDVAFNEDQSRVRIGHAARNLGLLRKIALNLLKQESSAKVGIKSKRLKAGWDEQYLLKVLAAGKI